jgi:hemerythrin superfamily protein
MPADPAPTAKPDALAILVRDHKEVDELFDELGRSDETSAVQRKGELLSTMIEALSVHAAVEEQVVYPVMRTDGEAKVRHAIADHQNVKERLADLEALAPLDPAVLPAVKVLADEVRAHVAEEENDLFPRLAQALDESALQEMGRAIEQARKTAPTRPHPEASDEPPANAVADVVAGAVDRVRDLLDEAADKGREIFGGRGKSQP